MLVEFYRAVWNALNAVFSQENDFRNSRADSVHIGVAGELCPTGTISMGNKVNSDGQQLLCARMYRDRFSTSVDGHKRN